MPVPTLVTDLSTTVASNSPAGSDNVFPDLDNYLRALSGFVASIRDNSGNGWVSPYLPLTYSAGTANGVVYLNGSKVVTTGSGLVFDGSNLGLGVTPSAWSGVVAMQMPTGAALTGFSNTTNLVQNAYYNGSWRYISTAAAALTQVTQGAHQWFTATSGTAGTAISFTQAMTLDASGNLQIGRTTSSGSPYKLELNSTADTRLALSVGTTLTGGIDAAANLMTLVAYGVSTPMTFQLNGAERARITSGGALVVGNTAAAGSEVLCASLNSANTAPFSSWNRANAGDNFFAGWYTEGTATIRGSIDYNRAGGLVRYNTTSDYRAKDIIGPVQNPGATIDALKVYEGVMKGATQSRPMLIAHEAQEHAPYAVSGVKDEVNEDGTPKFQQIDVSSLVPLLLAEIQSLRARVAALEAA